MCKNADLKLDWDDLRYVLAIARAGTLSRAGESLQVTHTTVGRRLRALEDRLGVRLFDRTPDGYVPTPAGQDIREVAEGVEGEVLSLEGRVFGRDTQLRGQLRVATMDLFFRAFHPAFSSFMARYPAVELTVLSSNEEVSLTRREAEVALRMTNTPPEYLVGRKLGRVKFAVYASRELVERVGEGAGYGEYPWLHWDERMNMSWLDRWLDQHAPKAKISMRVNFGGVLMRETVAAGIGVHFLACFDGDADPRIQRIGPVESSFGRDLWLLTLPELRSTNRIRAFMDHVDEALRASGSALAGVQGEA